MIPTTFTGKHVNCFEISLQTAIRGKQNVKNSYFVADFVLKSKKGPILLETLSLVSTF